MVCAVVVTVVSDTRLVVTVVTLVVLPDVDVSVRVVDTIVLVAEGVRANSITCKTLSNETLVKVTPDNAGSAETFDLSVVSNMFSSCHRKWRFVTTLFA